MANQKVYTVNVVGSRLTIADMMGWHAYYANGVTAVEIPAGSEEEAQRKAERAGLEVLYVFE